jgi:hypothetical protein
MPFSRSSYTPTVQRPGIFKTNEDLKKSQPIRFAEAARLITSCEERFLLLEEVEALLASKALGGDASRYAVRDTRTVVSLARRPVLFALARALASTSPI